MQYMKLLLVLHFVSEWWPDMCIGQAVPTNLDLVFVLAIACSIGPDFSSTFPYYFSKFAKNEVLQAI